MQCVYVKEDGTRCPEDSTHGAGDENYCYAHMVLKMATARRPVCTFEDENTPLGSCKGHVYDGRNPKTARCDEHGGR